MMEVTRQQMNGERTTGNYPPRFKVGDIIVCMNNDGTANRIITGELYKVGHEGRESYITDDRRDGTWTNRTKMRISHLNGNPVDGCSPWNYRFDLVESLDEESCMVCSSNCKKEETCAFFFSIIKEEET